MLFVHARGLHSHDYCNPEQRHHHVLNILFILFAVFCIISCAKVHTFLLMCKLFADFFYKIITLCGFLYEFMEKLPPRTTNSQ